MNPRLETPEIVDEWELNEWNVNQQLETAGSIFLDPVTGSDQAAIAQSLVTYQRIKRWAESNDVPAAKKDALWGLYLCYSRMEGHQEEAVAALQALRDNLETTRQKISDPHRRAGILIEYRYLFAALCKHLYQLRRYPELLHAIEGSKGRVVADVITQKMNLFGPTQKFSSPIEELLDKVQQNRFHYLTYFIDEAETFAVLVTKEGSIYTHAIAIGKNHLDQWLNDDSSNYTPINPHNWGKVKGESNQGGNLGAKRKGNKVINLSEKLANLVNWFEPLVEQGILQQEDHLCYCPDENLHLIPLHYLPFLGQEPLVRFFSVSRIHSAAVLVELLNRDHHKPTQFTAISVMAQTDRKEPKWVEGLRQVGQWLEQTMASGYVVANENATLVTLVQHSFEQQLIHFATHGIFPKKAAQTDRNSQKPINPYHSSGLVLANEAHQLPYDQTGKGGTLLTPEQVMEQKLKFSNSHITLQACVSGLAKKGIGGDALGLEWAFLLAGASSLLSTHWNVDVESASLFSLKFYQKWLSGKRVSRATAWRETVFELMAVPIAAAPQDWAAFSLSGDWR